MASSANMAALEKFRNKKAAERAAAPAADDADAIKKRNQEALAKRKAKLEAEKKAEDEKPLPAGWKRVESRSRPGTFVYENEITEERQGWFPEAAATGEVAAPMVEQGADAKTKSKANKKNADALKKFKDAQKKKKQEEMKVEPPAGWKRVESRSRPGEIVYENIYTQERQGWIPTEPAVDPAAPSAEEVAAKAKLSDKNAKALEKLKKKKQQEKEKELKKPLPEGWTRVESRSRPGEFVYENEYTEERQAWFPDAPAEKPLPAGWRKVPSRSVEGEFVYENMINGDRIGWRPTEEASDKPATLPEENKPKKASNKTICQAKALYDYVPENTAEEIELEENDIIDVEFKGDNGWWVGTNVRTGRNGIFPGTYVEEQ